MGREDGHAILSSTCFQLGIAGAQITRSFSLLIQHTGLTHKQVGLLAVVDTGMASSQREIATHLGVAPSLVVSLVDQLVNIGAVRRTRSTRDRRVQAVEITDEGHGLLRLPPLPRRPAGPGQTPASPPSVLRDSGQGQDVAPSPLAGLTAQGRCVFRQPTGSRRHDAPPQFDRVGRSQRGSA